MVLGGSPCLHEAAAQYSGYEFFPYWICKKKKKGRQVFLFSLIRHKTDIGRDGILVKHLVEIRFHLLNYLRPRDLRP